MGLSPNIAIIFAGGIGRRMGPNPVPKQFLEYHGKPILCYTLEKFQAHPDVDGIIVACLSSWMERCELLVRVHGLTKVTAIVPGGDTSHRSIVNGIAKARELYPSDSVLLIHDGVRPLIDDDTITRAIACVRERGSAITVTPATETVALKGPEDTVGQIIDRGLCEMARAPQCFVMADVLAVLERAREDGRDDFIDTATLMDEYGHKLHAVVGPVSNIKITTPEDFFLFKALMDYRNNVNVFGL